MNKDFNELLKRIEDFLNYQEELNAPVYISENQSTKKNKKLNTEFIDYYLRNIDEEFVKAKSILELDSMINQCQKCPLGKTRTKFVFGVGNPSADIVFVGEAPGADEDLQGEPFVGRAGKLLTETLKKIGLQREEVYICNILKCRPPNNRDPLPSEVEKCEPYLLKQLSLIKPKIIVALGRISGNTLLRKNETLSNLRKNVYNYYEIPLFVTFHPAAILRNMGWKSTFEEDLIKMKNYYDQLMEE
ncbi:MAG: uracil-DNA glycosylase [Ignavibacteria bacterium]